jgi:heptaprenyl diphosphate synthase
MSGFGRLQERLSSLTTVEAWRSRVEDALREAVRSEDAYLTEVASHLILAGGKRVRPLFAIASAASAGVDITDDVVRGGVAVELVHLGSLYHDDVIDEAPTRRTVESVNARWGNLTAILAGDFLLAKASEIAASLGTEVAGLLAATIGRLCEGEVGELRAAYNVDRTEAAYFSAIEGKTASLFATACRIGAIVGGLPRDQVEALTEFGLAYGMAFQIVDDVLDVTATEAELGKPAGHDLVEGVYTLPVLRALAAGDGLREQLGSPIEGAALDAALSVVRSDGAVPGALATARDYGATAVRALDSLPDNDGSKWLRRAVDDLFARVPNERLGVLPT